MPDTQIHPTGTVAVPADYKIPDSAELLLKNAYAHFDGSGAAGPFLPLLRIVSDAGSTVVESVSDTTIAAGASADASWFPEVGGFTPAPGTGVPPAGNLDGYIFRKTNLTVTAVGNGDSSNVVVQGNPITLDGVTSILIEVYCPCIEINDGAHNQACGLELWDATTDKGTMAYSVGNINGNTAQLLNGGLHSVVALTPAAGTHTYKVCAWKNIASDTVIVFANTFIDGTGNIAPCAYRVTVIPYDSTLPA